jgi:hypothetical protein
VVRRHPWLSAGVVTLTVLSVAVVAFVLYYFDPQALFINHTVDEPPPTAIAALAAPSGPAPASIDAPRTLGRGSFRSLEHHTTGTAILLRLADGSTVLRLENLDTSNGPDVHVTLSPSPSTGGNGDYTDYLDLGSLKGNRGNQNYPVPRGTDLTHFRSAVIWCKRFTVGFGVAPIA